MQLKVSFIKSFFDSNDDIVLCFTNITDAAILYHSDDDNVDHFYHCNMFLSFFLMQELLPNFKGHLFQGIRFSSCLRRRQKTVQRKLNHKKYIQSI